MKKTRIAVCILLILGAVFLAACGERTTATILEMELTENYDTVDPFINEKLIYVSDDVDSLELNVSFQMEGESGALEIADNETKEVLWSKMWNSSTDKTAFTISLNSIGKEKEYVVRFTGNKINYAKIVLSSENKLVKERERPLKPVQD